MDLTEVRLLKHNLPFSSGLQKRTNWTKQENSGLFGNCSHVGLTLIKLSLNLTKRIAIRALRPVGFICCFDPKLHVIPAWGPPQFRENILGVKRPFSELSESSGVFSEQLSEFRNRFLECEIPFSDLVASCGWEFNRGRGRGWESRPLSRFCFALALKGL